MTRPIRPEQRNPQRFHREPTLPPARTRAGGIFVVFLSLLASLLLTGWSVLAAGPAAASPSAGVTADPDADAPAALAVELTEVSPWLDESGTLRVRGTVHNGTDTDLSSLRVDLDRSTDKLRSRSAITSWAEDPQADYALASSTDAQDAEEKDADQEDAGDASATGSEEDAKDTVRITAPEEKLAAGATTTFSFAVPADALGLSNAEAADSWGPRGLLVTATASPVDGATEDGTTSEGAMSARAPAFTTWYPEVSAEPTHVSLVLPVTLPGFTATGDIDPATLTAAIADDGALHAALEAARASPELTLAVDPRLVTSIRTAIEDAGADPGEGTVEPAASATASDDAANELQTWLDDFLAEAGKHTVFALPYADADLAGLQKQDPDTLSGPAVEESTSVAEEFEHARTDIVWPVSGTLSRDNLVPLSDGGKRIVVVSDLQQPSVTSYTQNSHSSMQVPGDGGSPTLVESLAVDTGLSEALVGSGDEPGTASAISEYVAQTSTITAERPSDGRHLLVVLPRTAPTAGARAAAEAMDSVPWIAPESLDDLVDTQPVTRALLQSTTRRAGVATSALDSMTAAQSRLSAHAALFTDPETARTDFTNMALSCTSASFADSGDVFDCVQRAEKSASDEISAISPETGSPVLLVTGQKTTIPVTVRNGSAYEASVQVRVTSKTPQLKTTMSKPVTIPAGDSSRVDVPVEGVANADLDTTVEIIASDGYVSPTSATLPVHVRADWENIGTAVIGGVVALVFVVGLIKTVKRGRPTIPKSQLDDALAQADDSEKK